ncbi:MAG: dihydrolipoamide acetyltransferase family protein, partial [Ilumatobacter sp.]
GERRPDAPATATVADVDVDRPASGRPGGALASPAVRGRAAALGIEMSAVAGSGPDGRVEHADLDRILTTNVSSGTSRRPSAGTRVEAVRGVRRRIAERLSAAWSEIPHITYVEAIDATEVERLRAQLNAQASDGASRLTLLPFLARAIVVAAAEQPSLNAHFDGREEQLTIFDAVHIGIATQTDDGLRVPVVRHAEARGLRDLAEEVARVASAARDGGATRDELTGSTITITSLGALGGLATTPIINPPEVSIIGVNKMEMRPVWTNGTFEPRQMFNLSSSFDHRIVDGWDAAVFVQRIKALLETPALLFIDEV